MNIFSLLLIVGLSWNSIYSFEIIDLGGNDWKFSNFENNITGQATVPGNIYQDLRNNKIIGENFFNEYSDVQNSWISNQSWIYTKNFNVSTQNVKLVMNSLDTVGYVQINEKSMIIPFDNMFVKKEVNLKNLLHLDKENTIRILFASPVEFVNEAALKFKEANGYDLPPANLPDSYHGVNHANFIRKMQASFSWDWGPQFVTSGIVSKIYLVTDPPEFEVESAIIETVRVDSTKNDGSKDWLLRPKVYLRLNSDVNLLSRFRFYLNDEEIKAKDQTTIRINGQNGAISLNEFEIGPLSSDKVLPWYPNKFDYLQENKAEFKPNLYNFTVAVEKRNGSSLISKKSFRIGFKEIKLKKEELADGKSFYFEINGLPFFAKGVNYIPTTLNIGNQTEELTKFKYLLNQVKESNMNMIRIWGGGYYPIDEFYDLADELGIIIWQDFMYACALYETNHKHIESALDEVNYQVRRLQHHASIGIFSANNEIEGAISNKWWPEVRDPKISEKEKKRYILLFEKTIRNAVESLTKSIPFVSSSPTNDDNETFVDGTNPSNPRKGDIHYYNYDSDCLYEGKYPRARFVSEFGFQSYPSINTLSRSLKKEHLVWPITPELEHRQHAPGQNEIIINMIKANFDFKNINSTGQEALEEFIYLTQVSQALSIKLEAELYLSDRDSNLWTDNYSIRSAVQNMNMGTLVWQLNDVWEAPTWSSIDYYGNYKILQYYMSKFYSPIHVVANRENDKLVVTLINDSLVKVKITIYVIIYRNVNGYLEPGPAGTFKDVMQLDKLTVFKHRLNLSDRLKQAGCTKAEECFIRIDYNYLNVHKENFYLLGRPKDLKLKPVEIKRRIMKLPDHPRKYVVIVSSDQVALFVQLSWRSGSNIDGHFIDNGFNLLKSEEYILFEANEEYDLDYLTKNLQIRSIN